MGSLLSLFKGDEPPRHQQYNNSHGTSRSYSSSSVRSYPTSVEDIWGRTPTIIRSSQPAVSSYTQERTRIAPVPLSRGSTYNPHLDYTDHIPVKKSTYLSIPELETLMSRVDKIDRQKRFEEVVWIYRDKTEDFYVRAFKEHGGVMRTYIKDNTGDARSPINKKINGLFFATAQPPSQTSYFGSKRIRVPGSFFMSMRAKKNNRQQRVKLYFADFYCMSTMHWVTLILTYEGSTTDQFCRSRLPELDLQSNNFLYVDFDGSVHMRTSNNFKTEIFYTEHVDLNHWTRNGGVIEQVHCLGQSSRNGKPKKMGCKICNL